MDNQRKKVTIDETDTDTVISCHGTIFHVHSAILSFESEFFRAAFEGPFKEASQKRVEITGFDLESVKLLIASFYGNPNAIPPRICVATAGGDNDTGPTCILPPTSPPRTCTDTGNVASTTATDETSINMESPKKSTPIKPRLLSLVRLNGVADYYGVHDVRKSTADEIKHELNNLWEPKMFLDAAEAVVLGTGDPQVHVHFASAAARNARALSGSGLDISVLNSVDGAAEIILNQMAAQLRKADREHYQQLAAQARIHDELNKGTTAYNEAMTSVIDKLASTEGCKHCGTEFMIYIGESHFTYFVQCRNCFPGRN